MQKHIKRILKYCDVKLVFATASPRRKALAKKIKYIAAKADLSSVDSACPSADKNGAVRIVPLFIPTNADEVTLSDATATAVFNARLKGEAASSATDLPVIAFDTTVGVAGEVLGKPRDRADAIRMFRLLCGRTHEVVTAVYLRVGDKIIEKSEKTYISFGAFDKELVYNYVDSGAPYDKAGGYNLDDAALAPLITRVDGDRDNVIGLPVALTEKLIEENLIYGENGNSD